MGKNYIAEKRSEHTIVASGPHLIRPPNSSTTVPCITYVTLDKAVNTSTNTRSNGYLLYTSGSHIPKGSGWDGSYIPEEHSKTIKVEGNWMIFHSHKGKGNG